MSILLIARHAVVVHTINTTSFEELSAIPFMKPQIYAGEKKRKALDSRGLSSSHSLCEESDERKFEGEQI
jgi:hypothetical protein